MRRRPPLPLSFARTSNEFTAASYSPPTASPNPAANRDAAVRERDPGLNGSKEIRDTNKHVYNIVFSYNVMIFVRFQNPLYHVEADQDVVQIGERIDVGELARDAVAICRPGLRIWLRPGIRS